MRLSHRRAITIRETLVIIACAIVFLTIVSLFARASGKARQTAKLTKDGTQIRGIHQSWLVFSREFNGNYPTPGLIDRLPFNGVETPGRGEEDIIKNTTANLYSACIMGNYIAPELCIGVTEPSTHVSVFKNETYNFAAYDATQRRYWDTNFKADLHVLSHVSYAHMPIAGEMKSKHWRDTMGSTTPILGNRGPLGGVHDPNSITYKIHLPYDKWSGNIVFGDNHVIVALGGFPTRPRTSDECYLIAPECLPASKEPSPTDAAITFTKEMTETGPVVQHD